MLVTPLQYLDSSPPDSLPIVGFKGVLLLQKLTLI